MKKFKKVLAAILASSVVLSFAACGSKDNSSGATTSSQTSTSTAAATTSATAEKDPETGLPMMADRNNPITFKVFLRDPGQAPSKDNPVLKKITELTGVTMEFEFLVGDLQQKIGVMLAGGDYPDVVFGEGAKFVDAGAAIPIEDKILNYPNLKRHYEKFMDKMKAGFGDGHAYTIENYNAYENDPPIFQNGGSGFFMQKAVIEESGYKIPKTVDEYFQMIEDYKAKHPDIDGVKTIGFEVLSDGWRDFCLRNPAMHLLGSGNEGDVIVDQNSFTASLYQITDTAKAWYKKLNDEYHKGIIEAETFTQNYDQYIARLSSGAVLGTFDQYWNFQKADDTLKAAKKFNRTYIAVPIANPGVKDNFIDPPAAITGTGGLLITKNCKNVDRLLAYYDYLLNREVQDYLAWGVEGKDWVKVGTNGRKLTDERREIMRDTAKKREMTGDTLWQYTPKMQGMYDDGTPCDPAASKEEYMAALSEYDQNFLKALNVEFPAGILSEPVKRADYYPVWSFPIEDGSPAKVANTRFIDVCRKYDPQLILAKPADYDALWDKFVKEVEAANPQPYLDEVNRQIKEKMDAAKK
ncbi:extracellular solute-binding protein [Ruminiclostridium cellobioparum]|uniref:extracellular solute-binding protein n=1 Tax=Ruminiclostridium cellobioparum TaxID=29355 RepID=UPI0028AFF8EF|nr:extracellular solute-binding protein [Ruminiclostridium cellobioparum]